MRKVFSSSNHRFYKIVFIDTDKKGPTFCNEIQNYYFNNHYQDYIYNSNICDLSLSFSKLKFSLNFSLKNACIMTSKFATLHYNDFLKHFQKFASIMKLILLFLHIIRGLIGHNNSERFSCLIPSIYLKYLICLLQISLPYDVADFNSFMYHIA